MTIYTVAGIKIGLLKQNVGTGKPSLFWGKTNVDIINQALKTI